MSDRDQARAELAASLWRSDGIRAYDVDAVLAHPALVLRALGMEQKVWLNPPWQRVWVEPLFDSGAET